MHHFYHYNLFESESVLYETDTMSMVVSLDQGLLFTDRRFLERLQIIPSKTRCVNAPYVTFAERLIGTILGAEHVARKGRDPLSDFWNNPLDATRSKTALVAYSSWFGKWIGVSITE